MHSVPIWTNGHGGAALWNDLEGILMLFFGCHLTLEDQRFLISPQPPERPSAGNPAFAMDPARNHCIYVRVCMYRCICSCWEHLLLVDISLPNFLEIIRKARRVRTPTQTLLSLTQGSLRALLV